VTVICGLHLAGVGTWIAADSRATAGQHVRPYPVQKWTERGPWYIGVTGDWRTATLIRGAEQIGQCADARAVGDAVRKLLLDDGYIAGTGRGAKEFDNAILIASPDGLWSLDTTFALAQVPNEIFMAHGSGREYALGAAFALGVAGPDQRRVMYAAVDAACKFDAGCGGEVFVKLLEQSRDTAPVRYVKTVDPSIVGY